MRASADPSPSKAATRAAIQVQDYMKAISLAAQTALRNSIGSTDLQHLLTNRTGVDKVLQDDIAQKTGDWGISVSSVELRDVRMPQGLQDAMSREAQAEREKRARVKLAEAEPAIAEQFVQAATTYGQNTTAFALRGMNMTYEMANKGTKVVMAHKTRFHAVVLTLNNKEAASWIRQGDIEMAFTEAFGIGIAQAAARHHRCQRNACDVCRGHRDVLGKHDA